jgi:hypothetical protein
VNGFPGSESERDIKNFFENHPLKKLIEEKSKEKVIVNNVCLCYCISEYVKLVRERAKLWDYECILAANNDINKYKGYTLEDCKKEVKKLA